ncbi:MULTISPECIES: hypothetical protein [unclassified Leeuwenhoekiella]|uniref:hypothetical protein n=1 Tax=unclassified Leeuwenhoekiella TaxID=2615029 RepID=UPI000C3888D1|nr:MULTISPECIES: hypothetical protein [unclassified Leeuwenhoekiella]MAW94641.1 hypothetical protein [Leeuwenhoekiella sp.]MBA82064.1 hypothetical protein [Leeuwenhoekiella sp.]|tara:strand:- start:36746 stop:37348 length:603 start_codon:yes stop_codon:yes gene_type:complete
MTTIRISLLLSLFSIIGLNAQETETPKPKTNTISQQFEDLLDNSNNYQDYKVVKLNSLNKLKANTADSISAFKVQITDLQAQINTQQEEIQTLNQTLEETKTTLEETRAEKDSIFFLGIPMSKGGYMSMMWGIVAVLALALVFFIFRFKGSNAHTQEARKKLADLEVEYDEYRKKALEKEQKMGRLLQDERNKAVKNTKK